MNQRISGNCVLPLALWGSEAPVHNVTCMLATPDGLCILTGDSQGKIIVWQCGTCDETTCEIYSKWMLLLHKSSLIDLVLACGGSDGLRPYVVSVADDGDMALWDVDEGRCVGQRRDSEHLHTQVVAHPVCGQIHHQLYCCGRYPGVTVYDAVRLELLFTLTSSSPAAADWCTALTVRTGAAPSDHEVLAVSLRGGMVRWNFSTKQAHEDKLCVEYAKGFNFTDALAISSSPINPRWILVVSRFTWRICDHLDWSVLYSQKCPLSEALIGGEFISAIQIVLYTLNGCAKVFRLPEWLSSPPALASLRNSAATPGCPVEQICTLEMPASWGSSEWQAVKLRCKHFVWCVPHSGPHKPSTSPVGRLVGCNCRGDLAVYLHPLNTAESAKGNRQPNHVVSIREYWRSYGGSCGLFTPFQNHQGVKSQATVICSIQSMGKLAIGLHSGDILVASTVEVLATLYFTECTNPPKHVRLQGHSAPVTCLLHPHSCNVSAYSTFSLRATSDFSSSENLSSSEFHSQPHLSSSNKPLYDPDLLLSGSQDFSVRLWNLEQCCQLAVFHCHAAPVQEIFTVPIPPSTLSRAVGCVVSLAGDNSVSLLSLRDKKVILQCAHQTSPAVSLGWRPKDDFLLISCLDGSVCVWEIGTGYMDRKETGQEAHDIFSSCTKYTPIRNQRGHLQMARLKRIDAAHLESRHRSLLLPAVHLLNVASSHHHTDDTDAPVLWDTCDRTHYSLVFDLESLIVNLLGDDVRHRQALIHRKSSVSHASSAQLSQLLASSLANKRVSSSANLSAMAGKLEFGNLHEQNLEALQPFLDSSVSLETDQQWVTLLCSLLHPWGLNLDVDAALKDSLSLLCPRYLRGSSGNGAVAVPHWGVLSKRGALALLVPGWQNACSIRHREQIHQLTSLELDWAVSHSLSTVRALGTASLVHTVLTLPEGTLMSWDNKCLLRLTNSSSDVLDDGRIAASVLSARSMLASVLGHNFISQQQGNDRRHSCSLSSTQRESWSSMIGVLCNALPTLLQQQSLQWPLLQFLGLNWQNRCTQIRAACQLLLESLLNQMAPNERNRLVQRWSSRYLPIFSSLQESTMSQQQNQQQKRGSTNSTTGGALHTGLSTEEAEELALCMQALNEDAYCLGTVLLDFDWWLNCLPENVSRKELSLFSGLSLILVGVLASSYPCEHAVPSLPSTGVVTLQPEPQGVLVKRPSSNELDLQSHLLPAFTQDDYVLLRCICRALVGLLDSNIVSVVPSTASSSNECVSVYVHSPVQRVALDLLGRGFAVCEPFLDFTQTLLTLLHFVRDATFFQANMELGTTLSDSADTALTAYQSLLRIGELRPKQFILTLSREVMRYYSANGSGASFSIPESLPSMGNVAGGGGGSSSAMLVGGTVYAANLSGTLTSNSGGIQSIPTLNHHHDMTSTDSAPIYAARNDILRCMETLFECKCDDVMDVLVEAVEVLLFCVDRLRLKEMSLVELCPYLRRIPVIASSSRSHKVVVGTKNGNVTFFDCKVGKYHTVNAAHKTEITAVELSPEGKFAASYSQEDQLMKIWMVSTPSLLFGVGGHHVKLHSSHTVSMDSKTGMFPNDISINNDGVLLSEADNSLTTNMGGVGHKRRGWRLDWSDPKLLAVCHFNQVLARLRLP